MLKIGNPQINNIKYNQEFMTKTSDKNLCSNPIRENFTQLPNAYYMPTFGRKQNSFEQGKDIAKSMNTILKSNIGAVGKDNFTKELNKITQKTVIPAIKEYDKISPKKSLISSILKETGSKKEERKDAVIQIFDALCEKGKERGVQTEHYKENFTKELDIQLNSYLPISTSKLNNITTGLVQAVDNKFGLSIEEREAIKNTDSKDLHSYTTKILTKTVENAEKSFTEETDSQGFFGKIADNVSVLWDSTNRKKLVQQDIDIYKKQIKQLEESKNDDEFKKNFKKIFNVEYDPELIASYKNKEVELETAIIANGLENHFKETFSDLLNSKKLDRKIKIIPPPATGSRPVIQTLETKQEIFDKNYNAYAEYLGNGDKKAGAEALEKKFKEYRLKPESSIEEKFEVMQKMANKQFRRIQNETKTATKGKDLSTIKKEYNASYNATFGVENDIAKRVADYNISQEIGTYAAESLILGPVVIGIAIATAGTGMIPALKGAAITTGMNMAVYSADRLSSKKGMTKEDIEEILKYSVLDGSTFIASALSLKGIQYFTSAAFKAAPTAAKITEIALLTAAETAADMGVQKVLYSNVKIDGVAYSAAFSLAGQLLELKLLG